MRLEQRQDEDRPNTVLGIDLGTTNSCVAVLLVPGGSTAENADRETEPGAAGCRVKILQSRDEVVEGKQLIPSCVTYFRDGSYIVGHRAMQNRHDPALRADTVYDMKLVLCRTYKDLVHVLPNAYWTFAVEDNGEDGGHMPVVNLSTGRRNGESRVLPVQVLADVLRECKATAIHRLGDPTLQHAVITVPAKFTQLQKIKIKEAAEEAGLVVLEIITEPAAAAYAYGFDRAAFHRHRLFVFDFGGGTLDLNVVKVRYGHFMVEALRGEYLGGRNFDNVLYDVFKKEIAQHYPQLEEANYREALLTRCEGLKKALTTQREVRIQLGELLAVKVESVLPPSASVKVTRTQFEETCGPLLRNIGNDIKKLLKDCHMEASDITEVLLVGGSTLMPMIRRLLARIFTEEKFAQPPSPNFIFEAVASGAAIRAAQLSAISEQVVVGDGEMASNLSLSDCVPLALGVGLGEAGERFHEIFPRFTPYREAATGLPTKKSAFFTNKENRKRRFVVRVYEGASELTAKCHLLGQLQLVYPKELGVAGSCRITVDMEFSATGILSMTARLMDMVRNVEIDYTQLRMDEREVARLIDASGGGSDADRKEAKRLRRIAEMEMDIEKITYQIAQRKGKRSLFKAEKDDFKRCQKLKEWIKANRKSASKQKLEERYEKVFDSIGSDYEEEPDEVTQNLESDYVYSDRYRAACSSNDEENYGGGGRNGFDQWDAESDADEEDASTSAAAGSSSLKENPLEVWRGDGVGDSAGRERKRMRRN